jgi:hypothetical protein
LFILKFWNENVVSKLMRDDDGRYTYSPFNACSHPRLASARIRRNQRDIVTSLAQIMKAPNPIILRYDLQRGHAMTSVMRKCAENATALN